MRRITGILLVLAMVAVSCGDDDAENGDRSEVISGLRSAISESQSPDSSDDPFAIDDEQALCFATELVDDFGAGRMAEAISVEFEEFMAQVNTQERRQVIDALLRCVDVGAALAGELTTTGISQSSAECVSDVMLESQAFLDAVADGLAGGGDTDFDDPALVEALLPGMLQCLSAEELTQLGNS